MGPQLAGSANTDIITDRCSPDGIYHRKLANPTIVPDAAWFVPMDGRMFVDCSIITYHQFRDIYINIVSQKTAIPELNFTTVISKHNVLAKIHFV